jgi:hypothetical protein
MDDSDCELDAKIKMLNQKVSEITSTNLKNSGLNKQSAFLTLNVIKSPFVYYAVIPVVILLIFLFWKPSFIMQNDSIDGKLTEKRLNYKKLIIATIILSTIIVSTIIFINKR